MITARLSYSYWKQLASIMAKTIGLIDKTIFQIRSCLSTFPFPVHFCAVTSEFAEFRAAIRVPDLGLGLSEEEASLLDLLVELMFETSVGSEHLGKTLSQVTDRKRIKNKENDKDVVNGVINCEIDHEMFSQLLMSHLVR